MKLRKITGKDQDEEVRGCELCVVEFREKEKNKEDQGEEVRGCGLCSWMRRGKQREKKEIVYSEMRVDEIIVVWWRRKVQRKVKSEDREKVQNTRVKV